MKQVMISGGKARVNDVPAPGAGPGTLRVQVSWSCISTGTELATVRATAEPLHKQAIQQPEKVSRVMQMVRQQGLRHTVDRVLGKTQMGTAVGYSAAGVVIEVGQYVDTFQVGDRVACAGAGVANHAEIIEVPINLAVRVPPELDLAPASTVALGAIALQGVRRAAPTLGEVVFVFGLGIIGQITVQLLLANGCRVIATDLDERRREMAQALGAHAVVDPNHEELVPRIHKLSDGHGVDAVIVTASTQDSNVISQAFQATRRKGRVVVVGDVGLQLKRSDLYPKELDFLVSTSYGPGRYDVNYEENGIDYPIGYVRWTENRNMDEYVRLLAERRVQIDHLAVEHFDVDQAQQAYEKLQAGGSDAPLLALLHYPTRAEALERTVRLEAGERRKKSGARIKVAVVGAGAFATGTHLPNLVRLQSYYDIHAVVCRTGAKAVAAANQYQARYSTTDYDVVLADDEVNLVLISTRHDLHGSMTLKALQAGKAVFVEKPLALTASEVDAIEKFYAGDKKGPLLMTGFNRRFSPPLQRLTQSLVNRTSPLIVNYRMNVGYVPPDNWLHGPEGGGRNLGEACHIYDLFTYLCKARMIAVHAAGIRPKSEMWQRNDNFSAVVTFRDGSVCTLTYTALGHPSYPKEQMDVFADGKVWHLEEYKRLSVSGTRDGGWEAAEPQKGHLEELQSLATALRGETEWPIPLWHQLQATRIALQVEAAISSKS